MTTEVGSETEVRKEPEKAEEQPAAPESEPAATNQTDEAKAAEQSANDHPAPATDSAEAPAEAKEKQEEAQPADNAAPQEGEDTPASPPASEKKGISRFLPPWLKKQKSQSQVGPKESQAAPEEAGVASVKEEDGEKGEQAEAEQTSSPTADQPLVEEEKINGEPKPEQIEEVKSEEKEEENHSTGSADTQPAKEEKAAEESQEKSAAEEENKEAEEGGEEKKDEEESLKPEGGHSFIKSPLKLTKKVKMVMCHVTMLDGSQFPCEVEKRAKGQYLFFKVYEVLNLLEKDYFGLSYKDNSDQTCWLDPTKEIKRQIRNATWQFAFNVKFYPPDPSQLTEDITRYLLCLQLRQDIVSGRLPCSFVTHSLLGSYALQAELGDHDSGEHRLDYISDFQFAPSQTKEMEEKVVELHKTHRGMTPAQADAQFLENAKKLSMYGVDLHHAKDSEGVDIMLGVCANGLLIYKDRLRINRFAWPKILKISYKRSNFYIKIRPGETEQFESSVGFKLPNHRAAKRVWKVCVENHTFFRLMTPEAPTKAKFLTLGSKFRYSGRTQAQTRQASTLIDRPAPYFERTSSKRISRSLDGAPVINVTEAHESAPTSGENGREPGLELYSDSKSADDKQKSGEAAWQAAEVEIEETVVVEEIRVAPKGSVTVTTPEVITPVAVETEVKKPKEEVKEEQKRPVSVSSDSEEEEEDEAGEYHPQVTVSASVDQIKEEPEEEEEEEEQQVNEEPVAEPEPFPEPVVEVKAQPVPAVVEETSATEPQLAPVAEESPEDILVTPDEAPNGHAESPEGRPGPMALEEEEEEEEPRVNGDASHSETERLPQVICCSEPPVVKTEMVTISDTFAAQKTEIATKEVPIVHTETKTITYEAAQLDGSGDGEPGVLMTAQTITSESLCTTTTTHITKTLKGGLSETRIEKRIVITGDSDIDHDQALAQAIKEAKEQHPDMSVTRVVVHKETELAEEGED
ncbi:protein 4.1-like isoform X13 [Salvelinus fontinalis]|uniref:protein 4.1-like isoform X13 n=1 Tax=Salvelinus fontinalis TaxID=8038 RepID=UPI002486C8DF|nr:protein 4.1-like isoform X13 [Salvelinus fontinalis]